MANLTGRNDFDLNKIDHDNDPEVVAEALLAYLNAVYDEKCEELSEPIVKVLQPQIMLRIIDTRWMAHLQEMDYLKQGIGLRAYGQLDPLVEYKQEAYNAFKNLTESMYEDFLRTFLRLQMAQEQPMQEHRSALHSPVSYSNPESNLDAKSRSAAPSPKKVAQNAKGMPDEAPKEEIKARTFVKDKNDPYANVGRNDPCPCGSGKKFKKCHGAN